MYIALNYVIITYIRNILRKLYTTVHFSATQTIDSG